MLLERKKNQVGKRVNLKGNENDSEGIEEQIAKGDSKKKGPEGNPEWTCAEEGSKYAVQKIGSLNSGADAVAGSKQLSST